MAKPKSVGTLLSKEPITQLPPEELVQLNQSFSDATLAAEKHAHARTKVALIEAAARAQLAEARAEVATFFASKEATQKRYLDLTRDIRSNHNLSEKHAIDPMTGVIVQPEP